MTHTVAALLPEYLPVPQSAHVEVTEAPVAAEDLPAAQDTQESEVPTVVRYLPATQLMHTVAAAAVHFVYVQWRGISAVARPVTA